MRKEEGVEQKWGEGKERADSRAWIHSTVHTLNSCNGLI